MKGVLALVAALGCWATLACSAAPARDPAPLLLHLLDYIAVDYAGAVAGGEVKDADEYREMVEFADEVASLAASLPAVPQQQAIAADAAALKGLVAAKADASRVAAAARALGARIVAAHRVVTEPRAPPDAAKGAAVYAERCAACHGTDGHGDGPAAAGMDPRPTDFHEAGRMAGRTLFDLYNTVTLGVKGTAMRSFDALPEDDRWAVAAHVFAYSGAPATPSGSRSAPLAFARERIGASLAATRRGDAREAASLALEAYLEGFELVEKTLATVDGELVSRVERAMMQHRRLLSSGAPVSEIEREVAGIDGLLAAAQARLGRDTLSSGAIFSAALLILAREGLEAVLVLAAIFAFLRRAGRDDARRWVHAGWIGALLLGALTWLVSEKLVAISGAGREVTEGVTALISAAMLLYVGFWLHDKAHGRAWQSFIHGRVGGALGSGTVTTLATVSFLAVYREAFETVLFYQALAAQAGAEGHAALVAGVVAGFALLAALAALILRFSARLPLGAFFGASAVLLALLAIAFTGQGVAALQEAGWIASLPLGSLRLPMIGVFPTLQSLGAQAAVALVVAVAIARARRREQAPGKAP